MGDGGERIQKQRLTLCLIRKANEFQYNPTLLDSLPSLILKFQGSAFMLSKIYIHITLMHMHIHTHIVSWTHIFIDMDEKRCLIYDLSFCP